jgi:hypothetical protein
MPSQDNSDQLDRDRAIDKAREDVLREFYQQVPPHWNIPLGSSRQIAVPLASTGLSWLYIGVDIAAFVLGVAGIFLGRSWRDLGIALIVGAMFGISNFVGQLLAVQLNVEEHQRDLLWRDALTRNYAARLAEIEQGRTPGDESGGS